MVETLPLLISIEAPQKLAKRARVCKPHNAYEGPLVVRSVMFSAV